MLEESFFENPITIGGKVYLASDFHFGAPDEATSRKREQAVVSWLDNAGRDADHLFLLGDIFDFWFEYRDVVPKGSIAFLAKLKELSDKGIQIYYFTGNHDMWVKEYFTREMGIRVFRSPQGFIINGKRCVLGHGDGLDPDDRGYLFIKRVFANRVCIALYGALPPRWAFSIARACSHKSRQSGAIKHPAVPQEEATIRYIQNVLQKEQVDYFFFGHRHLPLEIPVCEGTTYFNTGDWLTHSSYIVWGEEGPRLIQ